MKVVCFIAFRPNRFYFDQPSFVVTPANDCQAVIPMHRAQHAYPYVKLIEQTIDLRGLGQNLDHGIACEDWHAISESLRVDGVSVDDVLGIAAIAKTFLRGSVRLSRLEAEKGNP
jgi:hypothetical protein